MANSEHLRMKKDQNVKAKLQQKVHPV